MKGETVVTALTDAVIVREREYSFMRRSTLVLVAVWLAFAVVDGPNSPVAYAVGMLWAWVVMGAASYRPVTAYVHRSVRLIVSEPGLFAETHRDPLALTGPSPGDEDSPWRSLLGPYAAAYFVPAFAAGVLFGQLSAPVFLASTFLCVAVWAAWHVFLWQRNGRPALLAQTEIDSHSLMVSRGYRWSWGWGWIRCGSSPRRPVPGKAVEDHWHVGADACAEAVNGLAQLETAIDDETLTGDIATDSAQQPPTESLTVALKVREWEVSRGRRGALLGLSLAVLLGVGACFSGGIVLFASMLAYVGLVMVPVITRSLVAFSNGTVAQIVQDPVMYSKTHSVVPGPRPGALAADSTGPLNGTILVLLLAGLAFLGYVLSWLGSHGAPLIVLCLWAIGFSLPGSIGPHVWDRHGRTRIQRETGLDSYQMMVDSGHTWTWCWGWLRDERCGT